MMLITNAIQGSCFCKVSQGSTARSCAAMPRPLITLEYTSVSLVIPRLGIGTLGKYIPFPLVAIKLEMKQSSRGQATCEGENFLFLLIRHQLSITSLLC